MSRLPGGVFVGVLTLLCGVIFAQFESVTKDRLAMKDSAPASPSDEETEHPRRAKKPARAQSKVALEPQKNLK